MIDIRVDGITYHFEEGVADSIDVRYDNGDIAFIMEEDMTGEYVDIYDENHQYVMTSSHINSFENGIVGIAQWFAGANVQ